MRSRAVRWIVFALLVAIGIGTGALIWTDEQRRSALDVHERDIAARVEGLTATARDIAAYQAAYVALAQPLQPSLDRVGANLLTLKTGVDVLTSTVRSRDATTPVTDINDNATRLAEADRTIRDNMRAGEARGFTPPVHRPSPETIALPPFALSISALALPTPA